MQCTTLQKDIVIIPLADFSTADLQTQLRAQENARQHAGTRLARAEYGGKKSDRLTAKQTSDCQDILDKTAVTIPQLTAQVKEMAREAETQAAAAAVSYRPLSKYVVRWILGGGDLKFVMDNGIRNAVLRQFFAGMGGDDQVIKSIRERDEWIVIVPSGEKFAVEACK